MKATSIISHPKNARLLYALQAKCTILPRRSAWTKIRFQFAHLRSLFGTPQLSNAKFAQLVFRPIILSITDAKRVLLALLGAPQKICAKSYAQQAQSWMNQRKSATKYANQMKFTIWQLKNVKPKLRIARKVKFTIKQRRNVKLQPRKFALKDKNLTQFLKNVKLN